MQHTQTNEKKKGKDIFFLSQLQETKQAHTNKKQKFDYFSND